MKLLTTHGVPHAGIKVTLAALGIIKTSRLRDPQPQARSQQIERIRRLAEQLAEII